MIHRNDLVVTPITPNLDLGDEIDIIALENRLEQAYNAQHTPYVDHEIEIDSDIDFGTTFYRVWCGRSCLGCFYRINDYKEEWVARPFYKNGQFQTAESEKRFTSHKKAQNYIIRCYRGGKNV